MAVYKVTFTPSGPYFFGNEKTFAYPGQKNGGTYGNQYFIRGEAMPSQTTLLGALRYCLLPLKGYQNLSAEENIAAIGNSSFRITSTTVQDFGKIKALSPVFLAKGKEIFIATPFDHNYNKPRTEEKTPGKKLCFYTPFRNYLPLTTPEGEKVYTPEYNAKAGITSSFMSLDDLHLESDLFLSDVRVGIRRIPKKDGFFKKEYRVLQKGFSFAVLAEIADDTLDGFSETVTLGQGKVPFAVNFARCAEAENVGYLTQKVQAALTSVSTRCENTYYCLGSLFLDALDFEQYYRDKLRFAIVKTRDFRNFRTQAGGKIEKSSELYRLVEPGSIFICEESPQTIANQTIKQQNAQQIGWNFIIRIGGKTND